jgi:HD-GYP domain-containing protein (c-di-GMP phosphodiesterase class II)/roadblock/LC7 domain-containing protein
MVVDGLAPYGGTSWRNKWGKLNVPEIDIQEEMAKVVAQLTAAVTNIGLYSAAHPQVGQYVDKTYAVLAGLLQARPEVTVMLVGDDLVAEGKPLAAESAYVANFIRILRRKSVERVTFVAGLPRAELQGFISDLAMSDAASIKTTGCIKLGRVELRVKQAGPGAGAGAGEAHSWGGEDAPPEVIEELVKLTTVELDELKDVYLRIKKHKQIDVKSVDGMVRRFIKGFREEVNPLRLLASLKSSHEYTFTHVVNVGILTMAQAESVGFMGDHLHAIGVASFLHDIGKLFVPEEIMNKKGKLDQNERQVIETHTTKGARYLMGTEGIPKLAVLAALEHHLKFDGSGYPSIKGGWTPNIASQMISIADVFDAMRSRRSYQEPQPISKIEAVLRGGAGKAFNPMLVENFFRLIRI